MDVALQRPIATGRIGIQPTAHVHRQVGGLLHRLHREISGCLDNDSPLATDPRDNGRPVFVIVAPTGLALLPAPTRAAPQRLLAAALHLPLAASGVVEVIRFYRVLQPAIGFVGHSRITQPPAPAIAGPVLDTQLPGNAS